MAPTILLTKLHPTNTLPPNIALSDFPLLETTPTSLDKTTTPNNAAAVAWAKLAYQKQTMDTPIAALIIQYLYACERTVHIEYSC